jgi:hypothetical protein
MLTLMVFPAATSIGCGFGGFLLYIPSDEPEGGGDWASQSVREGPVSESRRKPQASSNTVTNDVEGNGIASPHRRPARACCVR